jgi:uncharacterized protein
MSGGRSLTVGVTDLLRAPGTRREITRDVALDGLAISTAAVPPGAEITSELVLEVTGEDLVVSGTISVPWTGDCRRCLEPVEGTSSVEVREVFQRHPVEGETYALAADVVDLEPMVRDAVLLALPLSPLCGPDCRGPAPDAYPAAVEGDEPPEGAGADPGAEDPATSGEPGGDGPRDPRWAALDQLKFE